MWTNIKSGFDVEDETVNFGTRAIAESEVAVFETNTLATIQAGNKDELNQFPAVYGEYYTEFGCCLCIDKSVIIFNENCSKTLFSLSFESAVDAVCLVDNRKFILIGLASGELHFYYIPTANKLFTRLFNQSEKSEDQSECQNGSSEERISKKKTFLKIESHENDILIVTTKGKIWKILQLDFDHLETLSENNDKSLLEEFGQAIVLMDIFKDFSIHFKLKNVCGLKVHGYNTFFLAGKVLCLRAEDESIHKTLPLSEVDNLKFTKIEITRNESLCFALTECHKILILCMHTLIPIHVWDEHQIVDFTLLDGENTVLVITRGESCNMLLVTWPGFQVKFKLKVEQISFLIHHENTSVDILYVEGFGEEKVDTIRLKAIVEPQPESRLHRILRKGRFEEAEKLARMFNLDIEIVYKAQVQQLLQFMQPWNNDPDKAAIALHKFIALLEKITDIQFVVESCISAICPDFDTIHMILKYCHTRLSSLPNKNEFVIQRGWKNINSISQRLNTYQQIYGPSANFENWLAFVKVNLFKECQKHLKRGEINEAVIIWSRHWHEIKQKLTSEEIFQLLQENMPTWVKAKDIALWFRHFVPTVLTLDCDVSQHILEWTISIMTELEVSERQNWPEVGLDLAYNLLNILDVKFSVCGMMLEFNKVNVLNSKCTSNSPEKKLKAFIINLLDIQILKKDYGIMISCNDFVQLNDEELIHLILARTPLEKMHRLINCFLNDMMIQRRLTPDKVIINFIKELLGSSSVDWTMWDEAPWERMVAVLIPCINSIQERLECILYTLNKAPVPWSNTMEKIALDAIKLDHPLTESVQEIINIIPLKLIYKNYGFKHSIKETDKRTLIKHILLKDKTTAIEDVLIVAENLQRKSVVYQILLKHLIDKSRVEEAKEIFTGLDSETQDDCKKYLENVAIQHLNFNNTEEVVNYERILNIINGLLKKCCSFKMETNLNFSVQEFVHQSTNPKVVDDSMLMIANNIAEKKVSEEEVQNKISLYYSYLLDMSRTDWIVLLAPHVVKIDFNLAYSLCRDIMDFDLLSNDRSENILKLIVSLITYFRLKEDMISDKDVMEFICKLTTLYVMDCPANNIMKALDILNWAGLLKSINNGSFRININDTYTDPVPSPLSITRFHLCLQHVFYNILSKSTYQMNPSSLEVIEETFKEDVNEENQLKQVLSLFKHLLNDQQIIISINLWNTLDLCSYFNGIPLEDIEVYHLLDQSVIDLLKNIINARHFDLKLALVCLHNLEENDVLTLSDLEKSVSFHYQKLSSLSLLGINYCSEIKNAKLSKYYFKKHIQCTWAMKLSQLGLPYKEAFKESDSELKTVLLKLIKIPTVTLQVLKEYCLAMQFSFQEFLKIYLEEILFSWEPKMKIQMNKFGKKVMSIENTSEDLKNKCLYIIDLINLSDKQLVLDLLNNLWNKVNCYYYEVFWAIIEIMEALQNDTNNLCDIKMFLSFLQSYNRISKVDFDEREHWFQLNPGTQNLPDIAEFRLPFTLFLKNNDHWKFIKPELNLTTYKLWLDVIPSLRQDKDTLCSLTIHRLSSNQLSSSEHADTSGWCIHIQNTSLLADIQQCVGNISNLEMASASLYYVVNHMPPGADQVAAAEMCYVQAQKWVAIEKSEKSQTGLAKVEKKYMTLSTSHILHSRQLGQPKYLNLVLQPTELIHELYQDPSILNRKYGCTRHLPDINGAADDISRMNNMNIRKIRIDMLNDWLHTYDTNLDDSVDDMTCNITVAMLNHRSDPYCNADADNLIRACYILESIDKNTAASYLTGFVFGNEDIESRNILVKLRALLCLCTTSTKDVIEHVTGREFADIKAYMQKLLFIYELDKLGMKLSPDVKEILKDLLKRAHPQSLVVAAAVCKEFKTNVSEYWDCILSRMVNIEMVEELCSILPNLTPQRHVIDSEIFKKAWNFVILTPLSRVSLPLDEEQKKQVERSIEMIHKCPIPYSIDVIAIKEKCKRLNSDHLLTQLCYL